MGRRLWIAWSSALISNASGENKKPNENRSILNRKKNSSYLSLRIPVTIQTSSINLRTAKYSFSKYLDIKGYTDIHSVTFLFLSAALSCCHCSIPCFSSVTLECQIRHNIPPNIPLAVVLGYHNQSISKRLSCQPNNPYARMCQISWRHIFFLTTVLCLL